VQHNAFNSGIKLQSEVAGARVMVISTAESPMMIRAQSKYPNDNVLCLPLYGWGDAYDPSASIKGGGHAVDASMLQMLHHTEIITV
jgi:hypothetical protein